MNLEDQTAPPNTLENVHRPNLLLSPNMILIYITAILVLSQILPNYAHAQEPESGAITPSLPAQVEYVAASLMSPHTETLTVTIPATGQKLTLDLRAMQNDVSPSITKGSTTLDADMYSGEGYVNLGHTYEDHNGTTVQQEIESTARRGNGIHEPDDINVVQTAHLTTVANPNGIPENTVIPTICGYNGLTAQDVTDMINQDMNKTPPPLPPGFGFRTPRVPATQEMEAVLKLMKLSPILVDSEANTTHQSGLDVQGQHIRASTTRYSLGMYMGKGRLGWQTEWIFKDIKIDNDRQVSDLQG